MGKEVESTVNIKAERLTEGGGQMTFLSEFPERIDIHKYDARIRSQEQLLEKANIREDNKRLIKDFISFCKADPNVGGSRIRLYIYTLRHLARWTGDKHFKNMEKKDVVDLVAKIKEYRYIPQKRLLTFEWECRRKKIGEEERKKMLAEITEREGQNYSLNTVDDYLKTIKKFWKWLYDTDRDDPPQTRWIRRRTPLNGEPQIFSKGETKKLIGGCANMRDKAFFSCLYDLDCRVAELLTRQIKHIKYDEEGDIQIFIESDKTAKLHWEFLFESAPLLATWLKLHPAPENPNAPLWVKMNTSGKVEHLKYQNVRKTFIKICAQQHIRLGKRNHIHMLRKSKATHDLLDGVPLSVIESRGSWAKGSRALRECYITIQDDAKKDVYRKKYGLPHANSTKKDEVLELERCGRCQVIIENNTKFCAQCGFCADKTLREAHKKVNDEIASLVDKDMLSDMVKKIVLEALESSRQK